jgi:hypothetical protein
MDRQQASLHRRTSSCLSANRQAKMCLPGILGSVRNHARSTEQYRIPQSYMSLQAGKFRAAQLRPSFAENIAQPTRQKYRFCALFLNEFNYC